MSSATGTVHCTYRIKPDQEEAFVAILERHWPTLHKAGLVTDEKPTVLRCLDNGGKPFYVEIFSWKDGESSQKAHQSPAVMEVWGPIGAMTEARDGRPPMEFAAAEVVSLNLAEV